MSTFFLVQEMRVEESVRTVLRLRARQRGEKTCIESQFLALCNYKMYISEEVYSKYDEDYFSSS